MYKRLIDYTDRELLEELRARKDNEKPKPLSNPDFDVIVAMLEEGLNNIATYGHPGKDFEEQLFQQVVEIVYGNAVWKWWSRNYKG